MHTIPTQSWFQEEEKKLMGEVEFKIDNLDARNLRQLNQLYAEVKKVEGVCVCVSVCSLVPGPHPLTKRNGLVNQVEFLGLADALATV